MNWDRLKAYLLGQGREASTWRGLILLATALGANLNPEQQTLIITFGMGLAGAVGMVIPDATKAGTAVKVAEAQAAVDQGVVVLPESVTKPPQLPPP